MADTPKCFDEKSYRLLMSTDLFGGPKGKRKPDICEGCTAEYQGRMIRERRCAKPGRLLDA